MIDRKYIKQEIPGKATVCAFCPYINRYREGDKPVSSCLLNAWDLVKGDGARIIPVLYKGVDPPEGCVYYQRREK